MSWFISLENGRPSDLIVTCVEDVLRFATTTVNSVNVTNVGCTWDPAAVFVAVASSSGFPPRARRFTFWPNADPTPFVTIDDFRLRFFFAPTSIIFTNKQVVVTS